MMSIGISKIEMIKEMDTIDRKNGDNDTINRDIEDKDFMDRDTKEKKA